MSLSTPSQADTDLWLQLFGRFTIITSVLVLITFFVFTLRRANRFQNNHWTWLDWWEWRAGRSSVVRREIHQTPTMMPFTFSLKEDTINEVNQITFQMQCQESPFFVRLLWAVDASYLFKLINSHSWDFIHELEQPSHGELSGELNNSSLVGRRPYFFVDSLHLTLSKDGTFKDNVTVVAPRNMEWRDLSNQYKYPVAIFIFKPSNSSPLMQPTSNSIVGLCVILHVKNDLIPNSTAVLAQYIKLNNGPTHLLQPLYVMDKDNESQEIETDAQPAEEASASESESQPFNEVLCSVCQTLPVSRAIIPCRHVCLCAHCFGKVQSCPICRGVITWYFKTRDESYMKNLPQSNTSDLRVEADDRPWEDIITALNENVNAAFGLDDG